MVPYIQERGSGATFKEVSKSVVSEMSIAFPKRLGDQRRIAAILGKADGIRRKREQALEVVEDFLRSLFWDIFLGSDSGWPTVPLRVLSELINGDRSKNYPSGKDLVGEGVLFLSTKNISGSSLIFDKETFITKQKFQSLTRGKLKRGDLDITLRGSIGQCAIFDSDHETGS